jgi:LPXTG-motif cell wall-anchored protein
MKTFHPLTVAAVLVFSAFAAVAEKASSGPTSTVVYVGGNDLVVKSASGKLLNYSVAKGTMFTADGKSVGLEGLKPGSKVTKEISTGFDPDVISAVQVVTGKVFAATPPDVVTLSLAEGIKELTVPTGTTFSVDGKSVTIADLKAGATVTATIVTTVGADDPKALSAPAPEAPAMSGALLVAKTGGDAALPEAGTNLPLYGVLGLIMLSLGAFLMFFRRGVRA